MSKKLGVRIVIESAPPPDWNKVDISHKYWDSNATPANPDPPALQLASGFLFG